MFGAVAADQFDNYTFNGQHAPNTLGINGMPTLNAGQTYTFIFHPSMEATDLVELRTADGTVYTTGSAAFDYTNNGDPGYDTPYKGFTWSVPQDVPPLSLYYWNSHSGGYYNNPRGLTFSGSTYVQGVSGITLEGPAANQTGTNVMDAGEHGWISLDEQLDAGERLVLDNAFFADFLAEVQDTNNIFAIGLKGDNWTNTKEVNNATAASSGEFFKGNTYIVGVWSSGGTQVNMTIIANGVQGNSMLMNSSSLFGTACAFLEISNSGNNIRAAFGRNNSTGNITAGDESTVTYANWNAYKGQTGDQGYGLSALDVVMSFWTFDGGAIDGDQIDWTGLSEVSVPAAATNATSWNKALDFSGGSERTLQVTNNGNRCPIMMGYGAEATTVAGPASSGNTSNDSNARPWATAIVFNVDGNSSNQHIWNCGEGSGSTDDNIYLRLDASRNLYFGWGRSGALNECKIASSISTSSWYGVYIGFTGQRLSGNNASAANLADCFDIRIANSSGSWNVGSNLSTSSNWTAGSTGGRMDRQIAGDMTIGGRGANRNFHGKVAAMVVTTLRRNVAMPTDAEIGKMITDPTDWLTDYKVGNDFRLPWEGTDAGFNFSLNDGSASYGTQVWLMGDGTNDAYAQIRNQVWPATQSYTPMNMISMVSSDIETVTITGLT